MESKIPYLKLHGYVLGHWRTFAVPVAAMVPTSGFRARAAAIIRRIYLALVALFALRGIASFNLICGLAYVGRHAELLGQQFHAVKGAG